MYYLLFMIILFCNYTVPVMELIKTKK